MTDNGMIDYSEYEYQHVDLSARIQEPYETPNARVAFGANIDPLGGVGGLSTNEVAELVYFELQARIEYETEEGDQTQSSAVEHRGIFGANLPVGAGIPADPDVSGFTTTRELEPTDARDGQDATLEVSQTTDDRIFQHFLSDGTIPFDGADGGGGNANNANTYEKNYRQLTGRGPVLDSNDDLTVNQIIVVDDGSSSIQGNVRLHMVWDIAEVDDAGRAFSVPSDD